MGRKAKKVTTEAGVVNAAEEILAPDPAPQVGDVVKVRIVRALRIVENQPSRETHVGSRHERDKILALNRVCDLGSIHCQIQKHALRLDIDRNRASLTVQHNLRLLRGNGLEGNLFHFSPNALAIE